MAGTEYSTASQQSKKKQKTNECLKYDSKPAN